MTKYWQHVVRHVRSRNVVAHIRANLVLERHRQEIVKNHSLTSTTLGFDQTYDGKDIVTLSNSFYFNFLTFDNFVAFLKGKNGYYKFVFKWAE